MSYGMGEGTVIKDYVQTNMARFIIGSKSTKKDWDAYVKDFDGFGTKQIY